MRKKEPKPLTTKQEQILAYIKEFVLAKGYPPTVRDIGEAVQLRSTSSVHANLSILEDSGYIRRDPTKPRAIEILDADFSPHRREMAQIPVIGTVAAGQPLLAQENIEEYFPYPMDRLPAGVGETFMLHVKGNSMIEMGILEGDDLVCEKTEKAQNGDVVVALVDDSATVKRFYKEKDRIRLQPENSSMEPIYTDHAEVLGRVLALVRQHVY